MAANVKRLGNVDNRTILIVNGYIRGVQRLMIDSIIPQEIIDECIAFYFIQLLWDLSKLAKDDSRILKITSNQWTQIPLNQTILKACCNIFELEICINNGPDKRTDIPLYFGFANATDGDVEDLKSGNPKVKKIRVYSDELIYKGKTVGKIERGLMVGDKFKMVVDFGNNICKWYWNETKEALHSIPVDADVILPVVSAFWEGTEYEIVDYCFK